MAESADTATDPSSALRYTAILAAMAGIWLVRPVFGYGPTFTWLIGVIFLGVGARVVTELASFPVVLWWQWLAIVAGGAAVVGFAGIAVSYEFLPGLFRFVGLLVTGVVATNYLPDALARTPLAPDRVDPAVDA
jgi:hypothetical protein